MGSAWPGPDSVSYPMRWGYDDRDLPPCQPMCGYVCTQQSVLNTCREVTPQSLLLLTQMVWGPWPGHQASLFQWYRTPSDPVAEKVPYCADELHTTDSTMLRTRASMRMTISLQVP